MLRTSLILIIAALAGLIVLVLLMRLGKRHAEGSALIAWRHVIAAAVVLVCLSAGRCCLIWAGPGRPVQTTSRRASKMAR